MPKYFFLLSFIFIPSFANNSGPWHWVKKDFEVLMNTHGYITFAPYIHGSTDNQNYFPGYRSDFKAYVDFFKWKGFISNWLIANSTIIERSDSSVFTLDRIRYTLTPGYRMEFERYVISGLLLHECIHTISKQEEEGSIWWNSFQFGMGTNGAYQKFLVQRYKSKTRSFLESIDGQINVGFFLYGGESVWISQNHDYRFELFSLVRYHLGRYGKWGVFFDFNQHSWLKANNKTENKFSITGNLFLTGRVNIAALYYTYHLYDTFESDNEDNLGAFGFKIVF